MAIKKLENYHYSCGGAQLSSIILYYPSLSDDLLALNSPLNFKVQDSIGIDLSELKLRWLSQQVEVPRRAQKSTQQTRKQKSPEP